MNLQQALPLSGTITIKTKTKQVVRINTPEYQTNPDRPIWFVRFLEPVVGSWTYLGLLQRTGSTLLFKKTKGTAVNRMHPAFQDLDAMIQATNNNSITPTAMVVEY